MAECCYDTMSQVPRGPRVSSRCREGQGIVASLASTPTLPSIPSCVTVNKFLNFSVLQFSHL